MGEGRRTEIPVSDVSWSAAEIHLPQLLNEEAIADEFSKWEQVSSPAAERFAPRHIPSPARFHPLPSAFSPLHLTQKNPRTDNPSVPELHHLTESNYHRFL